MKQKDALSALGSLAHERRLRVFRMLVRHSPEGLAAGDIAAQMRLAPSSLSFHLGHLEHAGLITSRRAQRNVIYTANLAGMRRLLGFLTEDCCGGHPEICGEPVPLKRRRVAG